MRAWDSIEDEILARASELASDRPVLFVDRKSLRANADFFVKYFPGKVLYAVKCLPEVEVIEELYACGISGFDVSSIGEIDLVRGVLKNAPLHYNNPIKSIRSIDESIERLKVKSFAVDCIEETEKFSPYTSERDFSLSIRIAVSSGSDSYDFSDKFGAELDEAIGIIGRVDELGFAWGLTFHVGSNCSRKMSFDNAFARCRKLCSAVGKEPAYLNIGGGFPVIQISENGEEQLQSYFSEIKLSSEKYGFPHLICEPGRALVSNAGTLLTKVILRKDDRLYLNDGVYGSFSEINYANIKLAPQTFLKAPGSTSIPFKVFGPTCDSFDALDEKISLPQNINNEDLVAFKNMGAYSSSIATNFNGFLRPRIIYI